MPLNLQPLPTDITEWVHKLKCVCVSMIHLSYILQGTSSFSGKGQIEEDPATTEGVKIKRLMSIENSFESSVRSNILFLQMTLFKELQAFCPSPISPRSRLGSEVVEQRRGRGQE